MSSYFNIDNPLADIRTRTRKEEALLEQLNQMNESAKFHNSAIQNTKPITGKIMRYCSLDDSPLVKSKKTEKLEGLDIEIQKWKCKVCGQVYSGIGLNLCTPNKKVKAICFEMDGTL